MVFLPWAALLAPLALLVLWRKKCRVFRGLAIVLLAVSLGETAVRGLRVSSVFGWADTRVLASRWMRRHAPEGIGVAHEKYAQTVSSGRAIEIDMIARSGIDAVREEGMGYVMRNGAEGRRGMLHPVTRRRYPNYEARYQAFLSGSERLANWSLLPPRDTLTAFNAIHLELYGLRRFAPAPSFDGFLSQPVLIGDEGQETFFPVGRHLGSATALPVDERGVTCAVGGPDETPRPVYAILYTKERSADVRLRGFGRRVRAHLGPYDATVVPLERPWWAPRLHHVERIRARAAPIRHITENPAYLRIAFSEDEAGRILDALGHDPRKKNLRIPYSLEELVRLRESPTTEFAYRGVSAWYYDQFARLRIPDPIPDFQRIVLAPSDDTESPFPTRYERDLDFPAKRPAFSFVLRFDLRAQWHRCSEASVSALEFLDSSTGTVLGVVEQAWPYSSPKTSVMLTLPPGDSGPLRLRLRAPEAVTVQIEKVVLEWNIRTALDAEIRRVALARTADLLKAGRVGEAASAWRRIPTATAPAQDLPRRRLKLEMVRMNPEASPSEQAQTAGELLAMAPNHYPALMVLSDQGQKDAVEQVRRLGSGSAESTVSFDRFFRILDFSWDDETRRVSCTLEVLRDHPPPLALCLLRRRHGRWRTREKFPIGEGRPLAAGERFVFEFPVPESRKFSSHPNALALAIESDVRWIPGRLPASTHPDGVVRFSKLISK